MNSPCKLCKDDHLTHLCSEIEEASRFIAQCPAVLTNPLPHIQNMNSRTHDQSGGDQDPQEACSGHGCINMVHATKLVTHAKDYGSSQQDLGKEPAPPRSLLHNTKGVLKHSRHNPNARAAQNYSIVEDLGHTPCAMPTLKVL